MKKVISTILFIATLTALISSCTDENIKPQDGGGQKDCQFGCND